MMDELRVEINRLRAYKLWSIKRLAAEANRSYCGTYKYFTGAGDVFVSTAEDYINALGYELKIRKVAE